MGFWRLSTLALVTSVAVAALAGESKPAQADSGVAQAPSPPTDRAVLEKLNIVLGSDVPVPETIPTDPAGRVAVYRTFLEQHEQRDSFYDAILQKMFFTLSLPRLDGVFAFTLRKEHVGDKDIHFIRPYKSCSPKDAVQVAPWWDPTKPIWICKTSYRPELKVDPRSAEPRFCEAPSLRNPDGPYCGCGERLLNCARDSEMAAQVDHSYSEEVLRTMQSIMQRHEPFSNVLTMGDTVHDDWVEFFYARARYLAGEIKDLPKIDPKAPARLRPRPEFFSGSLMATPQFLLTDNAKRLLLASEWEDFTCTPLASTRVEAHTLMEAQLDPTLRFRAHFELTEKTGCKDCHARLENGLLALSGFTSTSIGQRIIPHAQPPGTTMKFYMYSSTDLRKEGPATTQFLDKTMAEQPELARCMVKKMGAIVYGTSELPTPLFDRYHEQFKRDQDLLKLLNAMVLSRFAGADAVATAKTP